VHRQGRGGDPPLRIRRHAPGARPDGDDAVQRHAIPVQTVDQAVFRVRARIEQQAASVTKTLDESRHQLGPGRELGEALVERQLEAEGRVARDEIAHHRNGVVGARERPQLQLVTCGERRAHLFEKQPVRGLAGHRRALAALPSRSLECEELGRCSGISRPVGERQRADPPLEQPAGAAQFTAMVATDAALEIARGRRTAERRPFECLERDRANVGVECSGGRGSERSVCLDPVEHQRRTRGEPAADQRCDRRLGRVRGDKRRAREAVQVTPGGQALARNPVPVPALAHRKRGQPAVAVPRDEDPDVAWRETCRRRYHELGLGERVGRDRCAGKLGPGSAFGADDVAYADHLSLDSD
jgi:hypothetical protein